MNLKTDRKNARLASGKLARILERFDDYDFNFDEEMDSPEDYAKEFNSFVDLLREVTLFTEAVNREMGNEDPWTTVYFA